MRAPLQVSVELYNPALVIVMWETNAIRSIVSDLRALGVMPGDTVLVHSSLRSLGTVPGGAETVIRGLLEAVGEGGTLLMPALSYATVSAKQPLFHALWTASCVGAIPEAFRTRPGTLRSVHPTHSVCACGVRAAELISRHHEDRTPVGSNSPFALLPKVGGKVLMLGCGLCPNTAMHGAEELVGPDYLLLRQPVTYVICDEEGLHPVEHRRHDFHGYAQRYDRIEMVMPAGLTRGKVLQADCCLMDAGLMWQAAEEALRRDPHFFVERLGA